MRIAVIAVAALVALGSTSVPEGLAKEPQAEASPDPSAWTSGVIVPIVDAEKAWRGRGVEVRRIRLFDHQLILTLSAPSPNEVTWALDLLATSPALKERTTVPGRLLSIGTAHVDAKPFEVDVLVNAHYLKPGQPIWDSKPRQHPTGALNHLLKVVERSSRYVNMRPRKHWEASRSIDGRPFLAVVFAHEVGSAEQFLKLLFNVSRAGAPTFLVAARWDAKQPDAKADAVGSPCLIELLEATAK